MSKRVTLNKGREQSIERRHPWIFSRALQGTAGLIPGDIVEVYDTYGHFLAKGFYEDESIAVRILSFDEQEQIDISFWTNRINTSYQLRVDLGLVKPNHCYRLVNGEGDFLPGLTIDVWGGVVEIQSHHCGIDLRIDDIVKAIKGIIPESNLKAIIYKPTDDFASSINDIPTSSEKVLYGSYNDVEGIEFTEGTMTFKAHLFGASGGGFSLEHWDNRRLVSQFSKDRRVLNLFSRAGGFTLSALHGGATSVVSVDSSSKTMTFLEDNLNLNFDPLFIESMHEAVVEDTFKYLQEMPSGTFDMVILDPPPFAKRKEMLRNALKGYRKLNSEVLRKIKSGGIVMTFSCSQPLSLEQFQQNIFTSALMAGRRIRIISQLSQPSDFPISIYHPEGEFLKGLILYVE